MTTHHNHNAGSVDIGAGALMTIGTYIDLYGEHILVALCTGAAGTVASIIVRVVYKKWFKKYFEKK